MEHAGTTQSIMKLEYVTLRFIGRRLHARNHNKTRSDNDNGLLAILNEPLGNNDITPISVEDAHILDLKPVNTLKNRVIRQKMCL